MHNPRGQKFAQPPRGKQHARHEKPRGATSFSTSFVIFAPFIPTSFPRNWRIEDVDVVLDRVGPSIGLGEDPSTTIPGEESSVSGLRHAFDLRRSGYVVLGRMSSSHNVCATFVFGRRVSRRQLPINQKAGSTMQRYNWNGTNFFTRS